MFVTQSADKVAEAERILGFKLERRSIALAEIQEVEVERVVADKVRAAHAIVREPVMIEDTGLYINAWNGLPGALIKWFVERVGPVGICRMVDAFSDRSAQAKTMVATYDGTGEPRIFGGVVRGRIAPVPAGEEGFGWDTIFIPHGSKKTFGQIPPHEKDRFSMRRMALEAMSAVYPSQTRR